MDSRTSNLSPLPWHSGELKLQVSAGVEKTAADLGRRFIRNHLIEQHRLFYAQLPFVVVGAVDRAGDPWATVISGSPGFLTAVDDYTLHVAFNRDPSDPADDGLNDGDSIGILGIELHTRRRNRLNGNIANATAAGLDIKVVHSYGNCPRYIQLRDFRFVKDPTLPYCGTPEVLSVLDEDARRMIELADAFFVASYSDEGGTRQTDGSSRGGKPGFVRVGSDGTLTIPDFNGNTFFNTLGNILLNGRAGLTFVDFSTGDMLQMTGRADVLLDSPDVEAFQGAERFWTFKAEKLVRRRGVLALRWSLRENGQSPYAEMTGDWKQFAERVRAKELAAQWRPFRVEHAINESETIRSLYLKPVDEAGLIAHKAGQHLPIRVRLPGDDVATVRTYTISAAPSDNLYRISVKRDGKVSQFLHELGVGAHVEALAPTGSFIIDPIATRPAVMLGAGVGITPIISMLRNIVYEGQRIQHIRKTWLFYSARSKSEQAFGEELDDLAVASGGNIRICRLLSNTDGAESRTHFDAVGRIDVELLKRTLPFDDYDYYLCGPPGFMQDMYSDLRGLNIADDRIYAESFGPSAIRRNVDVEPRSQKVSIPATEPVTVVFTQAGENSCWTPDTGTILELAEACGLAPQFGCRSGSCGTCATKVLKGTVAYKEMPAAAVPEDHALICCAYPSEQTIGRGLELEL